MTLCIGIREYACPCRLDVIATRDVRTSKGPKLARAGPDSGSGENAIALQKFDQMVLSRAAKSKSTSFKFSCVINLLTASKRTGRTHTKFNPNRHFWSEACFAKHRFTAAEVRCASFISREIRLMLAYSPPTIKIPKRYSRRILQRGNEGR